MPFAPPTLSVYAILPRVLQPEFHLLEVPNWQELIGFRPVKAFTELQCVLGSIFALLLVTVLFAEIPITTWLISRHIHSSLRARVVSVEYVLSLGMASAAVPLMAQMHARDLDFDVQFIVFAASSGVVFAAAMLLPQARRHAPDLPASVPD